MNTGLHIDLVWIMTAMLSAVCTQVVRLGDRLNIEWDWEEMRGSRASPRLKKFALYECPRFWVIFAPFSVFV